MNKNINKINNLNNTAINPDWAKLPLFDRSKWQRVKFGDVVANINDTERDPQGAGIERFIGLEHLEPGSLHIREWGNVADGTTFTRRCSPGQVLFGKRRAYQRKVAVAEFDAVVSGDIYVFAPKNDRLLPELLPFLCMSERFFDYAVETSAGSLSPRTSWTHLAEFEFDLPPLDQQRHITEILVAIDQCSETEWRTRESLLSLRKIAHSEVFSKGLAPRPQTINQTDLPSEWQLSTVGESCLIENRLRKPINAAERAKIQGEYPYFGPTGILDSINEYRIDGEYVLIGEDGDHFLKFDSWNMTQFVRGRFNVNNHAHLLRGSETCRTEWIFQYFKHRDITPFLSRQGSGRLKLQKSVLEKMPIPIPPLKLQDEILAFMRGIDMAHNEIEKKIKSTKNMLSSMTSEFLS
ncbi:MAG: restriction endonuclease subunit S [Burkholderiales bacterium]|nr:restriction endonuclease subunit S [Burkholderiales bacterium]